MIGRRGALALAFAVALYAAAMLATIPAPWVARAIARASERVLELRAPLGTLWNGSGLLYARLRSGGLLEIGPVRWHSAPFSLLAGHLASEIALGAGTMRIALSPTATEVRGLDLALPGRALAEFAPALGILGPGGAVRIRADRLRIEGSRVNGEGEIEWRDIRLARAGDLDFGSHVARLRGEGNRVAVELATTKGPLRLSGGGAWTPDRGLSLSAVLDAGGGPPALATFLQGVCADFRNGRCTFRTDPRTDP